MPGDRFSTFLFESRRASELDTRAMLGPSPVQPGAFKVISAVLNVFAKLLLHLVLSLGPMEKPGGE